MSVCCEAGNKTVQIASEITENANVTTNETRTSSFLRKESLLATLKGVPKPVLESVLGKPLGRRVWMQQRASEKDSGNSLAGTAVSNEDVVDGLLGHLSRQAGKTLRENSRLAKTIGLIVSYSDGVVASGKLPTMIATSDEREIFDTAVEILAKFPERHESIETVELTVSSIEAGAVRQPSFTVNFGVPLVELAHA